MDYLNMKLDGFTKESTAYDDFKKVFIDGDFTNESMLQEILHYANQYHTFYYGNDDLGEEINSALYGLRKLNQTTVLLFLFSLFDDFEAAMEELKAKGCKFIYEPTALPLGKLAMIEDPNGVRVAVLKMNE